MPAALSALEERLSRDEGDAESVIRLGFGLWNVVVEPDLFPGFSDDDIPRCAARFMELLREYETKLWGNADFCWSFGLGLQLFWFVFPGGEEEVGERLKQRACQLDPLYRRLNGAEASNQEMIARFIGRGSLDVYYNATALAAALPGTAGTDEPPG